MTLSVLKDIVLAVVAVYAAILSTINWFQARSRDKRKLRILLTTGIPVQGEELGRCYARLEATNTGHRPVTVNTMTLELPSGGRLYKMMGFGIPGLVKDTVLPVELSDGQSAFWHLSYQDIGIALKEKNLLRRTKITPLCIDSAGKEHKGEPWSVVCDELLGM